MVDMATNEVTIKGIVEPQAVCNKIMKRTKRKAKVLSPLPAAEGEPIPEVVASQVQNHHKSLIVQNLIKFTTEEKN